MIAQIHTLCGVDQKQRARYLKACRGKPYFGCVLPQALALLGKSQPTRFFAGPTLAVDLGGRTAVVAGHCDAEELASFLRFADRQYALVESDAQIPAGWHKERVHHYFTLEAGRQLAVPSADEELWNSLTLDRRPDAAAVARQLFPAEGNGARNAENAEAKARQEDFYATLCVKRNHGAARVWALEDQNGAIVCTVGAYALYAGEAYLACGQTAEALRGRGIGGRLIAQIASELAAEGWRVSLLCADERVRLYTRLGLTETGQFVRCKAP
jgi:GNAT superfamily N-acetyltransferase